MTIPNIATFDHGTYYFGKTLEILTFAQLLGFVFWEIFYGLLLDENHHQTTIWENMFWNIFQASNKQIQV